MGLGCRQRRAMFPRRQGMVPVRRAIVQFFMGAAAGFKGISLRNNNVIGLLSVMLGMVRPSSSSSSSSSSSDDDDNDDNNNNNNNNNDKLINNIQPLIYEILFITHIYLPTYLSSFAIYKKKTITKNHYRKS